MIFNMMALTGIMPHAFPVTSAYTHLLQMSFTHITHPHKCVVCVHVYPHICVHYQLCNIYKKYSNWNDLSLLKAHKTTSVSIYKENNRTQ